MQKTLHSLNDEDIILMRPKEVKLLVLHRYNLKELKFTSSSDSNPHALRNLKKAIHEGSIWKKVPLNTKDKKCHNPEAK